MSQLHLDPAVFSNLPGVYLDGLRQWRLFCFDIQCYVLETVLRSDIWYLPAGFFPPRSGMLVGGVAQHKVHLQCSTGL